MIICSCLGVHPCVCVCSYLPWSTATGASEEVWPFLPVPFTLSQHTWAIKLCGSVQHLHARGAREVWASQWLQNMCVWFVAYSTYHLIETAAFFSVWCRTVFLLWQKQRATEGKTRETAELNWAEKWPCSSGVYQDSGCSEWAGSFRGGSWGRTPLYPIFCTWYSLLARSHSPVFHFNPLLLAIHSSTTLSHLFLYYRSHWNTH